MRHEDLRLFLEIAETRNMRRAAERLGITQSALTKAVQRLETELHTRLFDRAPRGVDLTEAGRAFHGRVKTVEVQLSLALHELEHMRLGKLGLMRVGCTTANFDGLVRPVMERFLRTRPQARFHLDLDVSSQLIDRLLQGRLDFVVAGGRDGPLCELDQLTLFEGTMHAVVRSGHPLLRAKAGVGRLAECTWILPPPGRITRHWVDQRLNELGLPPARVSVETDATLALLNPIVRESDQVAVMTGRMLASAAGAGLRALDRIFGTGKEHLRLFWRRDGLLSPLARDFRDGLCAASGAGTGRGRG